MFQRTFQDLDRFLIFAFCGKLGTTPLHTVVATEDSIVVDGKEIAMVVKVGDRVIVGKYAGTEVKADGCEYNIVRQADILAIVE